MKIACLQFAPKLADVSNNISRAGEILSKADPSDLESLDLLVLPELAFSGYNFKSRQEISPFLEPTAAGVSAQWARSTALQHACAVTVGYPEQANVTPEGPSAAPECYNSTVTCNSEGEFIANYRKSFLYYTDETWAREGPGFYAGELSGLGKVAIGICMDLNPYKFEAPWSAWEFAHHVLHVEANLVIMSMAWLTREPADVFTTKPCAPDMETLSYWIARIEPLIGNNGEDEIVVVLANRTGIEDDAVYAGTSCVLGIKKGEVRIYGLLGRGEERLLVVDTSEPPTGTLVTQKTEETAGTS